MPASEKKSWIEIAVLALTKRGKLKRFVKTALDLSIDEKYDKVERKMEQAGYEYDDLKPRDGRLEANNYRVRRQR